MFILAELYFLYLVTTFLKKKLTVLFKQLNLLTY